jgi:hypothetical protein
MDNMPRPNMEKAGWVDASLEQTLAAMYLARMARQLNKPAAYKYWSREYSQRKGAINSKAWSEGDGIYYDVDRDGKFTKVKHIGAMWALLSGVASPTQAFRLVEHLRNPAEFYRPHLFPALAASDRGYSDVATYWQGGVWAPTNYMTIRGLKRYGFGDFAREAALNHLQSMAEVYRVGADPAHIDPNEADSDYHTIWECYNPDRLVPCTRADKYYYGRQDFAGWTAIGPVALMIEEVIGLEINGAENLVRWNLRDAGRIGLQNAALGAANLFSVVAEAETSVGGRRIEVTSRKAFRLDIESHGHRATFAVHQGRQTFYLK